MIIQTIDTSKNFVLSVSKNLIKRACCLTEIWDILASVLTKNGSQLHDMQMMV